jgi:uncharacterized membrane protein YjjB (DUF3815 family)
MAERCGLPVEVRLAVVCPCMVLVPGPHFLNGALDLMRARIPIGGGRIVLALMIVSAICCGVLIGLAITGAAFPQAGPALHVPFEYDVLAAGVAVIAYCSFFNMPWRLTVLPFGVGMAAHAVRWYLLEHGASMHAGAFGATLLVGTAVAPLAHAFRLPFGASAFSAVVSLTPGVLMFDSASATLAAVDQGKSGDSALLLSAMMDAATALIVILAMAAGLIIPKMVFDAAWIGQSSREVRR